MELDPLRLEAGHEGMARRDLTEASASVVESVRMAQFEISQSLQQMMLDIDHPCKPCSSVLAGLDGAVGGENGGLQGLVRREALG